MEWLGDWLTKAQYGAVPAWFGGLSLVLALMLFFRDRRRDEREQINKTAVWMVADWDPTLALREPNRTVEPTEEISYQIFAKNSNDVRRSSPWATRLPSGRTGWQCRQMGSGAESRGSSPPTMRDDGGRFAQVRASTPVVSVGTATAAPRTREIGRIPSSTPFASGSSALGTGSKTGGVRGEPPRVDPHSGARLPRADTVATQPDRPPRMTWSSGTSRYRPPTGYAGQRHVALPVTGGMNRAGRSNNAPLGAPYSTTTQQQSHPWRAGQI